MKLCIKKDLKFRKLYTNNENKYYLLKALLKNKYIDRSIHFSLKKRIVDIKGKISKVNNFCITTGKKRGIIRKFRNVRSAYYVRYNLGYYEGVRKIIW